MYFINTDRKPVVSEMLMLGGNWVERQWFHISLLSGGTRRWRPLTDWQRTRRWHGTCTANAWRTNASKFLYYIGINIKKYTQTKCKKMCTMYIKQITFIWQLAQSWSQQYVSFDWGNSSQLRHDGMLAEGTLCWLRGLHVTCNVTTDNVSKNNSSQTHAIANKYF